MHAPSFVPPLIFDRFLFLLITVRHRKFATVNPRTEETICEVQEADKADVDIAVAGTLRPRVKWGPSIVFGDMVVLGLARVLF